MGRHADHNFSQVPKAEIRRSVFDRSHGHKTTLNAGYLVPIYVDEVLPGDTFSLKSTLFGRLATPITPFMDNLYLETFYFFVPNRLVWDNWQKFMGEQANPSDTTDYTVPILSSFTISTSSASGSDLGLADYFGLPVGKAIKKCNALPFRAYNLIWNEWFRDENLQTSTTVPTDDGPDTWSTTYSLLRRGKRHDYFTSCLPWPQKGASQTISIAASAPIKSYWGEGVSSGEVNLKARAYEGGTTAIEQTAGWQYDHGNVSAYLYPFVPKIDSWNLNGSTTPASLPYVHSYDMASKLYADLALAKTISLNNLRQAFQVQRLMERDARAGTRYTEILRGHFGVVSPDGRLQRPEYLGGSSSRININPVEQTGATVNNTSTAGMAASPQGNLAAYGVAGDRSHGFTKSFTEHGYIIGLANIRADLSYQQGINRMWSRRTRYDFYWPVLSHLGEQSVLNKEIYVSGSDTYDDDVFGYQERWAEYRYYPSMISGQFRSTNSIPLDVWHLAQNFTTAPSLSSSFIQDDPPVSRVVAVTSQPHFLLDCWFQLKCVRPMPVYSVPGFIDHF